MYLSTDHQTQRDLRLLPDRSGQETIFSLFDHTVSTGGKQVMEDWFAHPLASAEAIEARLRRFKLFERLDLTFPVAGEAIGTIAHYLSVTDERTRILAPQSAISAKLAGLTATNATFTAAKAGILALLSMLNQLASFLDNPALSADGSAYADDVSAINGLLDQLRPPTALQPSLAKVTDADLATFDSFFRFKHRKLLLLLMKEIYLLDATMAVSRVAKSRGFRFPSVSANGATRLAAEHIFHPLLKAPVPNSVAMGSDGHVLFLTGANMAGKSTFMKSLSIALYLAHMGFPVAATRMEFTPLDGLYTTINLPDDLGTGESHFYTEVMRIKKIAMQLKAGKRMFVLFDELFRGTNVKDAYEGTVAVLQAFAQRKDSLFVVSTHIMEAGETLQQTAPSIRFVYLPTRMNGDSPVYTYRLANGITDDRHGMLIVKNEGILDVLEKGLNPFE